MSWKMIISQGRTTKPMEALLNSRKYKQRDETVTLGNVVNQLNSTSEKMAASNVKKAAILESLYQASRHDIVACGEARDSLFDMRSMRKSLQTQLKNDGHKNDGRVQRQLSRKQSGTERCYSAVSSGRLSNAPLYSGVVVKRNEKEKKYCTKEASTTMKGDKLNQTESAQSFYSRHMSNVDGDIREDSEIDSKEHLSDLGKNKQSCISLEIHTPATQCEERKIDLEHHDCSEDDDVFLSVNSRENNLKSDAKPTGEHISSKEKEALNSLTDPQLKESLQNIIKRRSSVRFVKSDSGYDMVNRDETINEQVEDTSDEQQQEADIESVAEEAANSDTNRSIKSATIRQASANQRQRLPSEATSISMSVHSAASSQRSRKIHLGRQEQKVSPTRRVSSARPCLSSASQRSLSSPILRRRKPELQTGETRVIRPATAKGYVPNLTNRKVTRKQSAMSSVSYPGILLQKDQAKNLAEVKMIREFLLMYAKVITKPKTEDTQKPVRMMSQTPELVIKSAIGQFLTRAFPSGESQEWNGLSATSKKERYEEQQRSKLLRIKICMKHLAAVA